MLIRAPLPLTLLSSIHFRSPEDRQAFQSATADVANVDLSSVRLEVTDDLFAKATASAWPTPQLLSEQREFGNDNVPALGQALGGLFAMLYHAANRSDLGLEIFRRATQMFARHLTIPYCRNCPTG
jgi:hypothetical protein